MSRRYKILRIIPTFDPKCRRPTDTIIDSSLLLYKDGFKVDIIACEIE